MATTVRVCSACRVPYLLTASSFYIASQYHGGFTPRCKRCICAAKRARLAKRRAARLEARAQLAKKAQPPQPPCRDCYGLAHRVKGTVCRCGLAYRPEP